MATFTISEAARRSTRSRWPGLAFPDGPAYCRQSQSPTVISTVAHLPTCPQTPRRKGNPGWPSGSRRDKRHRARNSGNQSGSSIPAAAQPLFSKPNPTGTRRAKIMSLLLTTILVLPLLLSCNPYSYSYGCRRTSKKPFRRNCLAFRARTSFSHHYRLT